ncbi:MAG: protein translocase subunit SecD [Anaerolineae bacterium]|nr:protein translocase subunit SecD [Thermoflexales bacterium]MDW8406875.1 protein translocase subunit SecD [Anaerolineae bacterium]
MRERNLITLVIVTVLGLFAAFIVSPIPKPEFVKNLVFWQDPRARDLQIKQGLDLKGGLQVLLAANLESSQLVTGSLESARQIIESRVNGLGVSEATVQIQGSERILVELPGITDPQLAIDLIQKTGQLEFVDGGRNPPQPGQVISTTFGLYQGLLYPQTSQIGRPITASEVPTNVLVYQTAFTGEILESNARPDATTGQIVVLFQVKPEAQASFREFTSRRIQQPLCIVLDGIVQSCPIIQDVLSEGGSIRGNYTIDEARQVATLLNYGSLPVPLKIESIRDVGATLGADSVRRSIIAGLIGLLALIVFMLLYYRVVGIISVIGLAFFGLSTMAVFILLPVTLTLPGIVGFLSSVASAVDANVLVIERFREEVRGGRTIRGAVETAYQRAWLSIRDSNLSTLIICIILFLFGNTFGASAVKGFAITLALGILISLFSAMVVTRTVMRLVLYQQSEALEGRKALLGV